MIRWSRWNGQAGSTQRVSASPSARTSSVCSGHGQIVGNCHGSTPSGRSDSTGPTTSGMTSPALRTITVSPGRTSLARHLVLVVQRGHLHRAAADEHRLEHGERRGAPGAPDRHLDVAQHRGALLRRELEGDRPARRTRREPEQLALGELVDLGDGTVDLVRQVVAMLLPVRGEGVHRVEIVDHADLRVHREAEPGEELERLVVAGERRAADHLAELVAPEAQLATAVTAGFFCRRLPAPALRGLAKRGCPAARVPLVERLEAGDRHVHLAAHLEHLGRAARQPLGHRADRGDVGRDVLPDPTVAARRGLHEAALLVAQAHRQPVDLQLADEPAGSPPRPRATRSPQAVSSARSIALSRLVIGTRWMTGANVVDSGAAPTCASASRR